MTEKRTEAEELEHAARNQEYALQLMAALAKLQAEKAQ